MRDTKSDESSNGNRNCFKEKVAEEVQHGIRTLQSAQDTQGEERNSKAQSIFRETGKLPCEKCSGALTMLRKRKTLKNRAVSNRRCS